MSYLAENRERLREIAESARPHYAPEQRRDVARSLLDSSSAWGPIARVALFGVEGWDYIVTLHDLAATTFGDLVVATVERLRTDPGVRDVVQGDRELVLIAVPTMNQVDLEEIVRWWWNELQEVAGASDHEYHRP